MRVLFIGNSHTYCNDMPQIFAQICRAEGVETAVAMLAHGGVGWDFHWKEPEARFNLLYGGYDAVVLQHCAHPMGDLQVMAQAGAALIRLAKAAGARPVLYMTWTQEADGEQAQPAMKAARSRPWETLGGFCAAFPRIPNFLRPTERTPRPRVPGWLPTPSPAPCSRSVRKNLSARPRRIKSF